MRGEIRGEMTREMQKEMEGEMRARFFRRCSQLGKVKGFALMFSLICLARVNLAGKGGIGSMEKGVPL